MLKKTTDKQKSSLHIKDLDHIRFYLQNPNGIKVEQDWMQWKLMMQALY
jgi:hypothetical protein